MKFLLGQRLLITFLYNLNYSVSKKELCYRIKLNKIKDEFNGIQVTNFHNRSVLRTASISQARRPDFY